MIDNEYEVTLNLPSVLKPIWSFIGRNIYRNQINSIRVENNDMLYFACKPIKNISSQKILSIQIKYKFKSGPIFIINCPFAVSDSNKKWFSSYSFYDFLILTTNQFLLKTYCKELDKSSYLKKIISDPFGYNYKLTENDNGMTFVNLMIKFLFSYEKPILPQNVRNYLAFLFLTSDRNYKKSLIDSIMSLHNNFNYVYLHPFLISSTEIFNFEVIIKNNSVISPIPVLLSKEKYEFIKNSINDYIDFIKNNFVN